MGKSPAKPRTGRPRKPRDPDSEDQDFLTTTVNAPVNTLNQLKAAGIGYTEAFQAGAEIKLTVLKGQNRTLADVERDLQTLNLVFLEYLEQKRKLLEERDKLQKEKENKKLEFKGSGLDSGTLSTNP